MKLQHILAATDFSHRAIRAVSRAAILASEHHATLDLLHVTQTVPIGETAQPPGSRREDLQRQVLEDIHEQMAQQILRLRERWQVEVCFVIILSQVRHNSLPTCPREPGEFPCRPQRPQQCGWTRCRKTLPKGQIATYGLPKISRTFFVCSRAVSPCFPRSHGRFYMAKRQGDVASSFQAVFRAIFCHVIVRPYETKRHTKSVLLHSMAIIIVPMARLCGEMAGSCGEAQEAVPQIATGKPYVEIPRLAAERHADLVVVGAHGEHFFMTYSLAPPRRRCSNV